MPKAISNTSPLLYLYRIGKLDLLPKIFSEVWTPSAVALDLGAGELATIAMALENPNFIVILDDHLARRTAQAAALDVWGTFKEFCF